MELLDRVAHRLKLRDLRLLETVVRLRSMAKAATELNISQPAVSKAIAELEQTFGVRLVDRTPRAVEPTDYGRALLDGGAAVFDDLRQAVKKIEFLADPTAGEIRIGSNESLSAGLLPAVFRRLWREHPGIGVHVKPVAVLAEQLRELRERKVDIILGRIATSTDEDITTSILFNERTYVVAGLRNKWARRRRIEISKLADEPWCIPSPDTLFGSQVADAFRAAGMNFPPRGAAIGTLHHFGPLLASEPFLAIIPGSLLRFGTTPPLKVLNVKLQIRPWPVGIMTLKNRTLSPVAQLFIDSVWEVAAPLAKHRW